MNATEPAVCDVTQLKDFLREQRLKQVAKKAA